GPRPVRGKGRAHPRTTERWCRSLLSRPDSRTTGSRRGGRMTTPLPPAPSLEQLRKQAKELARASSAGPQPLTLSQPQRALAREHGFPSWPRLKAYVERVSAGGPGLAHAFEDDIAYYEDRADGLRSVVASGLPDGIAVVRAHHPELAAAPEEAVRALS